MVNKITKKKKKWFKRGGDESNRSSIWHRVQRTLFLQSCLPSSNELHDKRLQNRMKICALAVSLMWVSSLRIAVYLASFAITLPSLETVLSSCKSAISITLEEQSTFSRCALTQTQQCDSDLDTAVRYENLRVNEAIETNTNLLQRFNNSTSICVEDYASLKRAVEGWVNELQEIPIKQERCTTNERTEMMSAVGDINVLKSETLAISVEFKRQSEMTLKNVLDYTKERAAYDVNYMQKHKEKVINRTLEFLQQNVIPVDWNIYYEMNDLMAQWQLMTQCMVPIDGRSCYTGWDIYGLQFEAESLDSAKQYITDYCYEFSRAWSKVINHYRLQYGNLHEKIETLFHLSEQRWEKTQELYHGWTAYLRKARQSFIFELLYESLTFVPWFKAFASISMYDMAPPWFVLPSIKYPHYQIYYDKFDEQLWDAYKQVYKGIEIPYEKCKTEMFMQINEFGELKGEVIEQVSNARSQLLNQSFLPSDYDPPQYVGIDGSITSLETDEMRFLNHSSIFMENTTEAIESVDKAKFRTPSVNTTSISSVNLTKVTSFLNNFVQNFESPVPPALDFDFWFLQIASISDLLFLLDFVFRIYFSIRMCYKYWEGSSIKLPIIDIRTMKEIKNPFKLSNGRLVISLISNPLVGATLAGFMVAWVIAAVTSAYVPLYQEYTEGCIPESGIGTFLTENIYSFSFNHAYREGSLAITQELEAIDVKKANICSMRFTETANKKNAQELELRTNANSVKTIEIQMGLFEKCIDTELADEQFRQACCNQTGYSDCIDDITFSFNCPMNLISSEPYPFSPPGDYIARRSCDLNLDDSQWQLMDVIFECGNLPECEVTCKGPSREKLYRVSRECGCVAEWFFHSFCSRSLLALIIFATMNFSRSIFVNGLTRYLWKHIFSGSFVLVATSDGFGTIQLHGEEKDSNKPTTDSLSTLITSSIKQKILDQTKWYRIIGMTMMVGAFSCNMVWVILILKIPDATKLSWLLHE